ncbi:protein amalgam-like [Scylla paramamosain]|uniref:protein amalgam-like n=1 Tax=Scylla paramamosain TaxID=85552 RepID=UPI00308387EE
MGRVSNRRKENAYLGDQQTTLDEEADDSLPSFVSAIQNVTVSVGRDARLSCVVENLGDYRVAWIYKGTGGRTVLTVATQVITKNPRISATQEAQAWVLTVTSLTQRDQGVYMCQVNTKPARKQLGYIRVVVPPTIDDKASSSDVSVSEGGEAVLTCEASGDPQPAIRWVREDGQPLPATANASVSEEHLGRSLVLSSASRNASGAYLCIATNGVPPAVSKRILLSVSFPPEVVQQAGDVVVGVAGGVGGVGELRCRFWAWPRSKVTWLRGPREVNLTRRGMTAATTREEAAWGLWTSELRVKVRDVEDLGHYRCLVTNQHGDAACTFQLVEITTTTTTTTTTTITTTSTSTSTVAPPPHHRINPPPASTSAPAGTQPPFVPWRKIHDKGPTTTITTIGPNSVLEGAEGVAADDDPDLKHRKTPLRYFEPPTSSSSRLSASSLLGTCVAHVILVVLLFARS